MSKELSQEFFDSLTLGVGAVACFPQLSVFLLIGDFKCNSISQTPNSLAPRRISDSQNAGQPLQKQSGDLQCSGSGGMKMSCESISVYEKVRSMHERLVASTGLLDSCET